MASLDRIKSPKPVRRSVVSPSSKEFSPTPSRSKLSSSKGGVYNNINSSGNNSIEKRPLRLRIVLVGSEQTGKSCLIKRYCEKRFVSKYLATIGIDYGATKIFVDKKEVSVHIFDTSGNSLFENVRNEFYKDAHGILLVFDVSRRQTFDELADWIKEIKMATLLKDQQEKGAETLPEPVVLVCANKVDLNSQSSVDNIEAKLWADLHGFSYCETSACSGVGVADMFHTFFSQIVRQQIGPGGQASLPRTPASARRVLLGQLPGPAHSSLTGQTVTLPTPNADQRTVMSRLREGREPWEQLGLNMGCSQEEVNKTYRKLAMMLHPDKTAVQGADEAFKLLGAARRSIIMTFQ